MERNRLRDDFLTCCTEEADELVDLLVKVKSGDLIITDVTKLAGNLIEISMNLINNFPNETQSFNVSFSGNYVNDVKFLAFLEEKQIKTVFYNVFSVSFIPEDSIEIEMSISVGDTIFYTEILTVEIIPKFEIVSFEFSEDVIQGVNPRIIIII